MTVGDVRRAVFARIVRGGVAAWLLAILVMVGVELLAYAATPIPGEPVSDLYYVSPIIGLFAPMVAVYIAARLMAGLRKPFKGGRPVLRFVVIGTVWALVFAIGRLVLGGVLALDYRRIESHWAVLLGYFTGWTLVLIRAVGIIPGLAIGEPSRHIRIMIRETRGSAIALALAVLVFVVPFAAIAIALEILSDRMPLDPTAGLALAGVQGVVEAVQLVMLTAVGVVAWDIAEPALRRSALRT